jgi:hypothetical protein
MESNWEPCLKGMLQYASAAACRRALLCRHFGEAPARCGAMCDVCTAAERAAGPSSTDGSAAAGAAHEAATRSGAGPGQAQKDVSEAARGVLLTLQVGQRCPPASGVLAQLLASLLPHADCAAGWADRRFGSLPHLKAGLAGRREARHAHPAHRQVACQQGMHPFAAVALPSAVHHCAPACTGVSSSSC